MLDIKTGKEMSRRDFGKGIAAILAAGCAPTIVSGAMMRMTGARMATKYQYGGLCFTAETAGATIAMSKIGSAPSVALETSFTGNAQWTPFISGTTTITLANVGDKVYFRAGEGGNSCIGSSAGHNRFIIGGRVAASGNVNSLLSRDYDDVIELPSSHCYKELFKGCAGLTSAPEFPAIKLTTQCYDSVFFNCYGLEKPPKELPAKILTNYCYNNMFWSCTSLVDPPKFEDVTFSNRSCATMFWGCSKLKYAPIIRATNTAEGCCYGMFSNCSSLITVPELPATTLSSCCYQNMFEYCTGLKSSPVLKATTLTTKCYSSMFIGCTNLKDVYTKQTSFTGCTTWLDDHSGATFHCSPSLTIPSTRTTSDVPPLWTVDPTYS